MLTADVTVDGRTVRCHKGYADTIRHSFECYYNAVEPENGIVDYSSPRWHQYRDGSRFKLSSLAEEPNVWEEYLHHYRPSPDDLVFDLGAYCGVFTVRLARLVRQVIAFEPDPINRECLETNLLHHGVKNVTIIPCAVAADDGRHLFSMEAAPGSGLSHCTGRPSFDRTDYVSTVTLASAVQCYGLPRFIKMDIEGAEHEVLRSSAELLKRENIELAIDNGHTWVSPKEWKLTPEPVERAVAGLGYQVQTLSSDPWMFTTLGWKQ